MSTILAFQASARGVNTLEDAHWELVHNPEHVERYGSDDFVPEPSRQDERVYINGFATILIGLVEPNDLVRVVGPDESVSLLCTGHADGVGGPVEPGRGRTCAFTRLPIHGPAMRCNHCGHLVAVEVVEQVGQCACGHALARAAEPEPPEGVLL